METKRRDGMSCQPIAQQDGFKKLQIADTIAFAIKNIPSVDERTLQAFLELINVTGTFGIITHEQVVNRIRQVLKYVPDACPRSLLIMADLLELKTAPSTAVLSSPRRPSLQPANRPRLQATPREQPEPATVNNNGHSSYR
jgi:hypothetical protein